MKGIITCMICVFAVALTVGGPMMRRQASQSEKTVPIGGNVTLECPIVTNDTWERVFWKKNNHTIYSLQVQSNIPTTNDTRYEVSNHATRLTIKDLQKTDSGIYHCKVSTLVSIKEGGQVLLSVTDQEEGLPTTSPGVPFKASTTIPTKPAEKNTIILALSISIPLLLIIIIVIIGLVLKYRERILDSRFVRPCRRLAPTGTASTSVPAPNHENVALQQRSPANSSKQKTQDNTTSSRMDPNASGDPDSSSSPLLHSEQEQQPLDLDSWKEKLERFTQNEVKAFKEDIDSALSNTRQQPDDNPSTSTDRKPQPYNVYRGKTKIQAPGQYLLDHLAKKAMSDETVASRLMELI